MKKLLIILFVLSVLFFLLLPISGYVVMIVNRIIGERAYSQHQRLIDMNIDTEMRARDKLQISESFILNIDTLWAQAKNNQGENQMGHVKPSITDASLYDPTEIYLHMIKYKLHDSIPSTKLLPISPKEFYSASTDTIIYGTDGTLCWAFIALSHRNNNGVDSIWAFSVIGKRSDTMQPFKIYIRDFEPRSSTTHTWVSHMILQTLYTDKYSYHENDIHPPKENWPTLSEPSFFSRHPLFKKYDDSTYHFEWYKIDQLKGSRKENIRRYKYPY